MTDLPEDDFLPFLAGEFAGKRLSDLQGDDFRKIIHAYQRAIDRTAMTDKKVKEFTRWRNRVQAWARHGLRACVNTRVPSEGLLALYREAETLSEQIRQWHGRHDSAGRNRLIEKRRQLGERIIVSEKEEDQQYERNRSTMSLKSIQTKFDCDAIDARLIADLLTQADTAGTQAAFGPPTKIEKHPEFEDDAGLDLSTLETALLLDEGVLLQSFRDRYKKAYASRPAAS